MAYADYQSPQLTALQQQPRLGFNDGRPLPDVQKQMPSGSAYGGILGAGFQALTAPDSNNQLPTNTRQQNLEQVQQAYARMPGDMGYLNGLLQQSSQAPTADDPIMRGAFAAGRVADQRLVDRQRAALAERLGAQGLGSSGAMNVGAAKYQQAAGENQALRESGQLLDEGNARRNALLQALGLDQNRYQGDNDLGYRLAALEAQLNQQALAPLFAY